MADRVRKAVCDGLMQVTIRGGYSNLVLRQLLKRESLAGKEAAFASALLYGTLERLLTLDKIIAAYARPGIAKLSPQVLTVLRASLYQLLYMESVPDYSAVHEGVATSSPRALPPGRSTWNTVSPARIGSSKCSPAATARRRPG